MRAGNSDAPPPITLYDNFVLNACVLTPLQRKNKSNQYLNADTHSQWSGRRVAPCCTLVVHFDVHTSTLFSSVKNAARLSDYIPIKLGALTGICIIMTLCVVLFRTLGLRDERRNRK